MRVLIVADNGLAAEAIRRSLRHAIGFHVVGSVDGRRGCGPAVSEADPHAVVIDEMTRPGCAAARIRDVRATAPEAKIVVLTSRVDQEWLGEVVAAGAHAAISKTVQSVSLGLLVREICSGKVFHVFPDSPEAARSGDVHGDLTRRELEILRLAADGTSNSGIARQLWVTEQTVKFHLSNVYRKLGVTNRTEASHYAHVHQLIEPARLLRPVAADQAA